VKKPLPRRSKPPANRELLRSFSIDHAERVTGLSKLRLARWDRLGLFSPEAVDQGDKGNPYARVYTFNDLVGLRTLAILVGKYRVPIREIRGAYRKLATLVKSPWSDTPLSVCKRQIVFDLRGRPRNVTDGQAVLKHIPLPEIADEVAKRTQALRKRRKDQIGATERRKFFAHNATVLAGTRIPVRAVESFIGEGYSDKAIVDEYPSLTRADVAMVRRQMRASA
jgi:DNA-binding transcriptional MerR regulator